MLNTNRYNALASCCQPGLSTGPPVLAQGATLAVMGVMHEPNSMCSHPLRLIELLWLLSVQNPTRTLPSYVLHGTKVLIYVCGWQKGGATNIVAHNVGLVTLSCLTLCNPMNYSLPGSSVHGISQARILEWVAILLLRVFPTQGSNLSLLHCRQILYHLSHLLLFSH